MPASSNPTRKILPVILCGGSGTRLWPVSRQDYPKQFCDLLGTGESLLQTTAKRTQGKQAFLPPLLICNEQHRFLVAQQLLDASVDYSGILLEPASRNTTAAIFAAAHWAETQPQTQDCLLWVMPADHHIPDTASLTTSVAELLPSSTDNQLITFGIQPTMPETGYGYIKTDSAASLSKVAQFVEKPDLNTAQKYLSEGYLWNSGLFAFTPQALLQAGEKHCTQIVEQTLRAVTQSEPDLDFVRLDKQAFSQTEDISIDYAIMEKADNVYVQRLDIAWNDIGSWTAIQAQYPSDENGNVLVGNAYALQSQNCHIHSNKRTTAILGCENISVIETEDAVLVLHQSQTQNIKSLISVLHKNDDPSVSHHRKVHRPWGSYQTVDEGNGFQVKRLIVKPGAELSLQKHRHRSEHWVVVKGTADVTVGAQRQLLSENQSTYIPMGEKHRLANPSNEPLELIEVQSGSYLGEDDIVRFEDNYNRAPQNI